MKYPEGGLNTIQKWMQAALVNPEMAYKQGMTDHYIAPAPQLSPSQSLAIYQRSYYRRLLECMQSQFKALYHTLGKELFEDFAMIYLRQYPSENPSLIDLGRRFPDFLEETRPDKDMREDWIDFMIAMARFEVDLYRIFDQEGSEEERMASTNTRDENLKVQAALDLQIYPFQVHKYYHDLQEGQNAKLTPRELTYIVFVRKNYQVRFVSVSEEQYDFIHALLKLKYVNEVINTSANWNTGIRKQWSIWRKAWINFGFFIEE